MDTDPMVDSDDPRDVELSTLSAIYPEIEPDRADPHSFFLDLPVHPTKPVQVLFPALVGSGAAVDEVVETAAEEIHELCHLPPLRLRISLPPAYPDDQPPAVHLTCNPPWIPPRRVDELVADCARLWQELGHDHVIFSYIDHLQQMAESAFQLADDRGILTLETHQKIAILDYDISAKKAAFERETFDCGICLDPRKGSACHQMFDCGHVFCVACLQDFYNNAIKEGDISSVRCLAPNCAKERQAASGRAVGAAAKRKRKQKLISPSELLQIPLDPEVVRRFVTLKYKSELESDKNTVYCPRPWCKGAARSTRHKKPQGIDFVEDSGESNDEDAGDQKAAAAAHKPYNKTEELLCICEDCGFAFCGRCLVGWHGEFYRCTPRREQSELTAEEKASLEYVQLHTTPCPTCAAPAQKTHGCNHMICGRQGCQTHFCYLCSAWLDPSNPYSHYNQQPNGRVTSCYNRLWELEAGDGDDVGLDFIGGRAAAVAAGQRAAAQEIDVALLIPEIEEADGEDGPADGAGDEPRPANEADNERGVALEAPLVLRIAAEPLGRAAPPPAPNPPPAVNLPAAGQHNQRRRGGRGGRNGGVRGGRGGEHAQQNNDQARNNGLGRRARRRARDEEPAPAEEEDEVDGQLNAQQRAWIRQFVQMALDDREDLVDSDSDEEVFWIR